MTTIQAIVGDPSLPWGVNNDMVTWKVQTSDGVEGLVFRKVTSAALEVGQEIQPNGSTNKGQPKFKVVSGYSGGGQAGGASSPPQSGGGQSKGEFRTPEQIIRSTAIGVAVSHHNGSEKADAVIFTAAKFEHYITNGAGSVDSEVSF